MALILDGVDGKVARRTGTSTALGARFDMEVDAFLILVLSVYVSMALGPWVLLIGAHALRLRRRGPRRRPGSNAPLPPSMARKTVAALPGHLPLLAGRPGCCPTPPPSPWCCWRWARWCGRSAGTSGGCGGSGPSGSPEGREETAARPLPGAVSDAGAGPASVSVPGMVPASPTSFSIPVPVPAGVTPLSQAAPADRGMPTALAGRA